MRMPWNVTWAAFLQVPRGKPHPDVFLEAAKKLGALPGQCLVLEDAPSGVEVGRCMLQGWGWDDSRVGFTYDTIAQVYGRTPLSAHVCSVWVYI